MLCMAIGYYGKHAVCNSQAACYILALLETIIEMLFVFTGMALIVGNIKTVKTLNSKDVFVTVKTS